jgi:hypothetical protein
MSATTTAYTPLESLLLFQALRADGFDPLSFQKISRDLQGIPLVTKDKSYDPARLGPDALKDLYLGLLKEEVKRDNATQSNGDHATTNGDTSPGSRKRKAPSPTLPTVRDAAQHAHLIPQLVMRLYARYRENAVREIRLHERDHDAALAANAREDVVTSPKPPPVTATQDAMKQRDHVKGQIIANENGNSPRLSTGSNMQTTSQPQPKPFSQAKIDAVMNHGPEPQDDHAGHRRVSSNTALPPLSEMAPQSPRFGIPPKYHANHGVQPSPPAGHQPPYSAHHSRQNSSAMSSPLISSAANRASSSPRPVLPPPPGMNMPPQTGPLPGSPSMHHGPPPNMTPQQQQYPQQQSPYSPQHRFQPGAATPTADRQPRPYAPHQPPAPGYYPQQQYQDRQTTYQNPPPGHPAHIYPGQPPRGGGYMLPPFQVAPQEPAKTPHQQAIAQQQASRGQQTPPYAGRPQYNPYQQQIAPSTAPRLAQPQNRRLLSDILTKLSTPTQPARQRLWKSERKPQPPYFQTPGSPKRPDREIEPLSPQKPRAPSPARPSQPIREVPELKEPSSSQAKKGARKSNRQARENSVASSVVEGSLRATRSQSVSSIPASEDRPLSRRRIKNEPSTPADTLHDVEDSDRLSVTGHTKRTRRGTMTQFQSSSKRKRQQSHEEEDEPTPEPAARKNTITATRGFGRMALAITEDVGSHKHGNRFNKPVRDKDASGYSEIILKPRDLKSIRAAITAGTRAVNAATATATSNVEDDSGSTTVELERSADLMPPKAIVNGAQLEKELLHMLANAVMFNPGEDGMVADTREMFDDVETRIRDWRDAERDASVLTNDDGAEDEGKKKRRKL